MAIPYAPLRRSGLDRYLDEHRGDLHARFQAKAPWWLPESVEDRIFHRLLEGARAVIDDMANDGEHQMRRQLDVRLAQLVEDLQTSPELQARGDRLDRKSTRLNSSH